MHGGFNSPWLKTLSEDCDNQTRVKLGCVKSTVVPLPNSCFVADECISPKRLTVGDQRDQNAFDFVFQPKMLSFLSLGLSQNGFTFHFVPRSVKFQTSSYIGRGTELYPPRLLTLDGIFPDPMNENTNSPDKYGNAVIQ